MPTSAALRTLLTVTAIVGVAGCSAIHSLALGDALSGRPRLRGRAAAATPAGETLVGAGDIGLCALPGAALTGALLDLIPGAVFTAGDNAYPDGSDDDFARCYDPVWGRQLARTRPTPGNHEYREGDGYWRYFGPLAGTPGSGYYSFQLNGWHVVALNSNLEGAAMARQVAWLEADLAAHPARCTLAYWHHPLFVSAADSTPAVRPLWRALHAAGADVVLGGHHHGYERFAPLGPDGAPDPRGGLREFIVGTGGAGLDSFGEPASGSQRRIADRYGVLRLHLLPTGYAWDFIGVDGRSHDDGRDRCH